MFLLKQTENIENYIYLEIIFKQGVSSMSIKYKFKQWGIMFMIPFTLTLISLNGGIFLFLFFRDQAKQDTVIEVNARNLTEGVVAARSVFANNQDLINNDSRGNYEFKHLNPASAASQYIDKINDLNHNNIQIRQTSDLFRDKQDAPDEWEKKAIEVFRNTPNLDHYSEKLQGDEPVYRYAVPLFMEKSCLQCHGEPKGEIDISEYPKEGYKLGDLRGIISVEMPLSDYRTGNIERIILFIFLTLGSSLFTWLVGQRMVNVLQKVANTDRLTQVNNRNLFYNQLGFELEWAMKRRVPLALIMLDIDHFKKINDQYGHLAGDQILRQFAKTIKNLLRHGDTIVRIGGEEFMIILPNTDEEGAYVLAERSRVYVENYPFSFESMKIPVTVSAGVTALNTDNFDREKIKDILPRQADKALYCAKNNGRNRVERYKETLSDVSELHDPFEDD